MDYTLVYVKDVSCIDSQLYGVKWNYYTVLDNDGQLYTLSAKNTSSFWRASYSTRTTITISVIEYTVVFDIQVYFRMCIVY